MSIEKVTLETKVTTRQVVSGSDLLAPITVTRSLFGTTKELTPVSTPPVTKYAASTLALAGGLGEIDLTNVESSPLASEDMTGLKIQILKLKAKTTNSSDITVEPGAANGYDLLGAGFTIVLEPGQEITFYGHNTTPVVAAGDKMLDFSATGTADNEIEYCIAAG